MFSSGDIARWHEMLFSITIQEWMLFVGGLICGIVFYGGFYYVVYCKIVRWMKEKRRNNNWIVFVDVLIGICIIIPNFFLIVLSEISRNFFLPAFAFTGILLGIWIFTPADK